MLLERGVIKVKITNMTQKTLTNTECVSPCWRGTLTEEKTKQNTTFTSKSALKITSQKTHRHTHIYMLYVLTHFISCPTQVLLSLFCKALSPALSLALSLTPHYLHITSEHVRAHTDTHTSVCQRCCSRIWEHWRHGSDLSIDPNGKRVAGSTPGHPRGYWVGRGDRGRALGSDDTIGMAMMREIMGCFSRSKRGEGKGENCRLVIGGGDYVTWYVWRHIQPRPWAQMKECRMHSRPYNTHTQHLAHTVKERKHLLPTIQQNKRRKRIKLLFMSSSYLPVLQSAKEQIIHLLSPSVSLSQSVDGTATRSVHNNPARSIQENFTRLRRKWMQVPK